MLTTATQGQVWPGSQGDWPVTWPEKQQGKRKAEALLL